MENLARSRRKPPKVKPIARKRHNYIYLFLAILLGIGIGYIFINFPPSYKIPIQNFGLPILPFFLLAIAAFIYSTLTFIFIQKTQGILASVFITVYLILRIIGLTHWIFLALLLALFIAIELFLYKKK
jgi:hypothetical protein